MAFQVHAHQEAVQTTVEVGTGPLVEFKFRDALERDDPGVGDRLVFERLYDAIDAWPKVVVHGQLLGRQSRLALQVKPVDEALVDVSAIAVLQIIEVLLGLREGRVGAGDVAVDELAIVGVESVVGRDLKVAQQRGQVRRRRAGQGAFSEDVAADDLCLVQGPHNPFGNRFVGGGYVLLRRGVGPGPDPQLTGGMAIEGAGRSADLLGAAIGVNIAIAGRGVVIVVTRQLHQEPVQGVARRRCHRPDELKISAV